jgi:hypothetical protein
MTFYPSLDVSLYLMIFIFIFIYRRVYEEGISLIEHFDHVTYSGGGMGQSSAL